MAQLIETKACPQCSKSGKGRSLGVYEDGAYCYECGFSDNKVSVPAEVKVDKMIKDTIQVGEYRAISARGINLDTAKKYKCTVAEYAGKQVMCMSLYKEGKVVAQKLKFKSGDGPKYIWLGDTSEMTPLWGMDIWEPNPKLSVVVCEGETDMLCRSSLNENKWPVVGLTHGAGPQALKQLAAAKEYLSGFKKIVLMFDGDETGRKCAEEASKILGPKAVIAKMPDGEDVCSMYQSGRSAEINQLELQAYRPRPKDIVSISDYTDEELYTKESQGIDLPFPGLNKLVRGLKQGRLYMVCAGSGLGKSTFVKEIAYDLMFNKDVRVGCIFLEQSDREAMRDYIALDNNVEAENFSQDPDLISKEQRDKSKEVLSRNGVFYRHFGSLDSATLISKIEYMVQACDCEFIFLDHITMVVSGSDAVEGERRDMDKLLTRLRTCIQSMGKSIIAVSHLKRPPAGLDYNSGASVNLSSMRGTASLEQLSDYVIALERDQFDELSEDQLKIKVLKSRRGGKIGYADTLKYSFDTGRLNVYNDIA